MNKEKLCPMKRESLSDEQLAAVQGGSKYTPEGTSPSIQPTAACEKYPTSPDFPNPPTVTLLNGVCQSERKEYCVGCRYDN